MMLKQVLIVCTLIVSAGTLAAQNKDGAFMVYSEGQIPSLSNRKIFEDSRGFIWICTKNGLFLFDGFEFRPFYSFYDDSTTLGSNSLNDMEEDAEGNLWISTVGSGVVKMDYRTGKIKRYPHLTRDSNPIYSVNDIYRDEDNTLWFATGGRGIARYIPGRDSFVNYLVDPHRVSDGSVRFQNEIRALAPDPVDKNILWVAGLEGLYRFNKQTHAIEKFEYSINGVKHWGDNAFHCIYIEDLQHIWLGTWGGGLVEFNYSTRQFHHYLINAGDYRLRSNYHNIILDIDQQSPDRLYICSFDEGFMSFDKKSKRFTTLLDPVILNKNSQTAFSLTYTKDGSIWVAGKTYILHENPLYNQFRHQINLHLVTGSDNFPPIFTGVVFDTVRRKYFVTLSNKNALFVLNDSMQVCQQVKVPGTQTANKLSDLFIDQQKRLIVAANSPPYLMYMEPGSNQLQTVKGKMISGQIFPRFESIVSMKYDGKRFAWIACNNNLLIRWDLLAGSVKEFPVHTKPDSHLPDRVQIITIAVDRLSNVWLCTNSGIFFFNNATEKYIHYYSKGHSSRDIASDFTNAIAVDNKGYIWIAPQFQGLQVLDPRTGSVVQNYSTGRGTFSNHIDGIICDSADNIWCTSSNGLLYFNQRDKFWKLFTTKDGLPGNVLELRLRITGNNKIFIGPDEKLVIFDPEELAKNTHLPVMHITGFDVNGKNLLTDTLADYKKNIDLSYSQNEISVAFTGIETLFPHKLQFFYRLTGLDKDWKKTTTRKISFSNLPPGRYTFEARAVNSDGFESRQPAMIAFFIRKPYWQQTWFIILSIIAGLAVLYVLYRYRVNQLLRVQKVTSKISADLHDDIGARLTNIQLLTLITKRQVQLDANTIRHLDSIDEEVHASAEALHEIVTGIYNNGDRHKDAGIEMRRYAAQVFELGNTHLSINIDDNLSGISLPFDKRRDIMLVYKEIINNINKHADAHEVMIHAAKNGKMIQLVIKDDGKGFDVSTVSAGNGLGNIRQRTEKWEGVLQIASSPGKGTLVKALFPV